MPEFHYLYKTTNIITGKFYIGMHSTKNMNDGYLGSGQIIKASISKYGKHNHDKEILAFVTDREELKLLEAQTITKELLNNPNCMNLAFGGHGASFGIGPSDATRKRMSEAMTGSRNHNYGKPKTDDFKRKSSASNKGKKRSEETKQRMRIAQAGRVPCNKKAIVVDGIEYESISQASILTGIKRTTIRCRVNSKSEAFANTYFLHEQKDNTNAVQII